MKLIKIVYTFFLDMVEASHAANLARNGKIKQSQEIYKKP